MSDSDTAHPGGDPREADVETAQEVDPKSGRSDDPRIEPAPNGDGQGPGGNGDR